MIRSIGLTPAAVEQMATETSKRRQRKHKSVARMIPDRCVLVVDSTTSHVGALKALRQRQPDELRRLWEKLLDPNQARTRVIAGVGPLDPYAPESLRRWATTAAALALDSGTVELLEGEGGLPDSPEVLSLEDLTDSDAFETVRQERQEPLPKGAQRSSVWSDRFVPLVPLVKHLYVIDLHLCDQVFRWHAMGVGKAADGALWFLKRVAQDTAWRVHIASIEPTEALHVARSRGVASDQLLAACFQALADRCGLDRDRVEVRLTPPGHGFPHQRSIHFDKTVGLTLHNGLATFQNSEFDAVTAFLASRDTAVALCAQWNLIVGDSAVLPWAKLS